jgi:ribosomal protein L7Ae-like RNA K-turn-binding protein
MAGIEDYTVKMITLMQFARKAGKLVWGTEACLRNAQHGKLKLIVMATDTSTRTKKRVAGALQLQEAVPPSLELGTQSRISDALGLPETGVFGLTDRRFADKIKEYHALQSQVEEPCR